MSQNANLIIIPSESELQTLRDQISEAKRLAEYAQLKRDLQDIVTKSVNMPNEFEGVMQIPDTDQILKTKREKPHFFEMLAERLRGMFSVRPIIGNVIALLIACVLLYSIYDQLGVTHATKDFLAIGIEIFAAIQIIKSGTRSLLLPFLALVVGCTASHSIASHNLIFHFGKDFYQYLMVVGIIGLGVSVLSID